MENAPFTRDKLVKLSKNFNMDNYVTSVPNETVMQKFIQESILITKEGKLDLRGWEHSQNNSVENVISVLGLRS